MAINKQRWLELREDPSLTPQARRMGDILFKVIVPFKFPKTHRKLLNDRAKRKVKHGLKQKGRRLSNLLKYSGIKRAASYFKPHYKSVKGVRFHRRLWKKPFKKTVEYGRRHQLIIAARLDRHYRKYGPMGG